jgi:hypothetical protein
MAEQTFVVNITGYWLDRQRYNMTESAGLVFVYEAKYNEADETVDLLGIIYIGEAANVTEKLNSADLQAEWRSLIKPENELCYACASVDNHHLIRVAAAYVNTHVPPGNKEYTESFPFDQTTVISTGRTALLYPVITARRNTLQMHHTPNHFRRSIMIPARAIQILHEPKHSRKLVSGE